MKKLTHFAAACVLLLALSAAALGGITQTPGFEDPPPPPPPPANGQSSMTPNTENSAITLDYQSIFDALEFECLLTLLAAC